MSSRSATFNTAGNTSTSNGFDESNGKLELVTSFDDFFLNHDLLRGIYAYGWENPTPIQQRAIKPMMDGRDTLAQAQSGTGKTGAFSVGSLAIVDTSTDQAQVLVLSPTRELASQTYTVFNEVGQYLQGLSVVLCVGGTSTSECRRALRGAQVVVGTPGRLNHMIQESSLIVSRLKMIVLDEADEMLDRGFRDIMYDIFQMIPAETQVCLFSATYTPEVLEVSQKFMREPAKILVKTDMVTLDGIKQFFVNCEHESYKFETLCDLYENISIGQLIIFCNTQRMTEILRDKLEQHDFTCSHIHGSMSTDERKERMKAFRDGYTRVLISTDLLARGIDVPNVDKVVNYDLPHNDFSNYIHRIGRSGRYGKKGVAINFITNDQRDHRTIRGLEEHYSTVISELPSNLASIEE